MTSLRRRTNSTTSRALDMEEVDLVREGQPEEVKQSVVFGMTSEDMTDFFLLLVPFALAWTVGCFGFSSLFVVFITIIVFGISYSKKKYTVRHAFLTSLIGKAGVVASLDDAEKTETLKEVREQGISTKFLSDSLFSNDHERAEWLNTIIHQMWPFISDMIKSILKDTVEPSIQQAVPKLKIEFQDINLGKKAPRVVAIKVYPQKEGDDRNRIELDCQLAWVSDAKISVSLLANQADIEQIMFFGKLRISLAPLLSDSPIIGAMSLTFLTQPDIEYSLSGLASVANAPGISTAVKRAIDDSLATFLVIPNRINIDIAPKEVHFLNFRLPEGVCRVTVIQARNLENTDQIMKMNIGKSDPYVVTKLGSEQVRTQAIDGTLDPVWITKFGAAAVTFDLSVHDLSQEILVEIWDKDIDSDDFMGEVRLPVFEVFLEAENHKRCQDMLNAGEVPTEEDKAYRGYIEKWFNIGGKKDAQGSIKLKFAWLKYGTEKPEHPIPIQSVFNHYLVCVYIDRVVNIPAKFRGRPVFVEVSLDDEKKITYNGTAPDCSFAEAKWFYCKDISTAVLKMTLKLAFKDKEISSRKYLPARLINGEDDEDHKWSKKFDLEDNNGSSHTFTVAVRRLMGHPKAYETPNPEPKKKNSLSPKKASSIGNLSSVNSIGSCQTLRDFSKGEPISIAELTWRYSMNSQTLTIVIHKVDEQFPTGAKIKCQCGNRAGNSRKHPNIINDKIEIKKCDENMASRIDILVRKGGRTLARGAVDVETTVRQAVSLYRQ